MTISIHGLEEFIICQVDINVSWNDLQVMKEMNWWMYKIKLADDWLVVSWMIIKWSDDRMMISWWSTGTHHQYHHYHICNVCLTDITDDSRIMTLVVLVRYIGEICWIDHDTNIVNFNQYVANLVSWYDQKKRKAFAKLQPHKWISILENIAHAPLSSYLDWIGLGTYWCTWQVISTSFWIWHDSSKKF